MGWIYPGERKSNRTATRGSIEFVRFFSHDLTIKDWWTHTDVAALQSLEVQAFKEPVLNVPVTAVECAFPPLTRLSLGLNIPAAKNLWGILGLCESLYYRLHIPST